MRIECVQKNYYRFKKVCAKVASVRKKCVKSERICHKYLIVDVRMRSISFATLYRHEKDFLCMR